VEGFELLDHHDKKGAKWALQVLKVLALGSIEKNTRPEGYRNEHARLPVYK
jgi:hypothetical protein